MCQQKRNKMAWDKQYVDFAVVRLDGSRKVRVYKTLSQYVTINVSDDVTDARWGGDNVVVYLKKGKILRYSSQSQYTYIN